MKSKKDFFILAFLVLQLLAVSFLKITYINYFLTAEIFFFFLSGNNVFIWLLGVIPYIILGFSPAFTSFFTAILYYFLKDRTKISVKYSLLLFLFLYFFTVRYEPVIIKAVMPGFLAFVSVVYAITRVREANIILAPALLAYTLSGILYSFFYSAFGFFKLRPYFLYSSDIVQIVIATVLFVSFKDLKKEFPAGNNKHNEG